MKRNLLFVLGLFISTISFGQLSENFDGATFPPSGWSLQTGSDDWDQSNQTADHTTGADQYARYDCYDISGSNPAYLITPKLEVTTSDKTFAFWANYYYIGGSYGSSSELYVDVSNDNGVSWTSGTTNYIAGQAGAGWFQTTIDLSSYEGQNFVGSVVLIRFKGISDWGSYNIGVDDVTGPAIYVPSCPDPTAQGESNITTTGADLGWTDASGSHWDIYVVAAGGAAPIQTTTPTANDVTANPYTWSGGSAGTPYDWYVRSDCGQDNANTSAWVGPSTFYTSTTPTTIPFTQDFETNSYGPHIGPVSASQSDLFINAASANASSYGVQMEGNTSSGWSGYSSSTTETQAWNDNASHISSLNITVDATAETVVQLDFDLKQTYSYGAKYSWFRVVVNGTQVGSSYNPSTQNSDAFQTLTYDLSAYAGTTFTLSLQHSGKYNNANGSGTPGGDNAYVDNISITAPSCFKPSGLVSSEETATTVRLSWNPASLGTGYDWEVVPLGDGQGNNVVSSGNVSDTTVVASGLTGGTTYDAYVRTECGSDYIGPLHFTTACPAKITTFPYTADFENAGAIQNCWTNDPTDAGGEWKFVTSNSHGPTADHTSGTGYYALLDDYLIQTSHSPFNLLTPIFDLSTTNKWYKVSFWTWIGPNGATNPIAFEVSLDGGTTWSTLKTFDHATTGSWFETSIDLGFNKSDNVQFRFVGTSIYGYYTDNSGVDDFTIEETQAPPIPLSNWAVFAGIFFMLTFMIVAYRRRIA